MSASGRIAGLAAALSFATTSAIGQTGCPPLWPGHAAEWARCVNAFEDRENRPNHPFPEVLDILQSGRLDIAIEVDAGIVSVREAKIVLKTEADLAVTSINLQMKAGVKPHPSGAPAK